MDDTTAAAGSLAVVPLSGQADFSRTGEVLRDIARGGLSGVLAGIVTGRRGPSAFYAALTLMGTVLVLPFVLLVFLTSDEYDLPLRAGYALFVVGLCTAAWWGLRIKGSARPPQGLVAAARGALIVAVILGVLTSLPHVSRALGLPS